jgi:cytochrome c oxidase cbb3-type subunit III
MLGMTRVGRAVVPLFLVGTLSLMGQTTAPRVDAASAARGATTYAGDCAKCHGASARGSATAPDLLRSHVVLHDRFEELRGKEFPAVLSKAPHNFEFTAAQLADLSQFLTLSVNNILRSGYSNEPVKLLTGNAKAGEEYFNGDGGCSKCHSVSGDLAGVGKRYPAATLQQKFLFPNSGFRGAGKPPLPKTQVTVTLASSKTVKGTLVRVDDFNVSLRESSGAYATFERGAGVKVELIDPFAGHIALLDKYTDSDIHNLLAYLVTIQ